ncbi:MAG: spore coat protein CotJB [Bacilli bacterium]|nr:spore coat protein CotJB [Bacilli bacterium]
MLFDNDNFDFSFFQIPMNNENNRVNNLLQPKEALARGNSFKDEYVPYKKYTYYPVKANNQQEEKLLKIMELCFAINDLNLYLDLNPDDTEKYSIMKKYVYEMNRLMVEYDRLYSPLTLDDVEKNSYEWIDNPWPWDNLGGNMYV